jgi:hypothetical protein
MDEYWNKVKGKVNEFWQLNDKILCIKVFKSENQTCQLCGYHPISWNHVLENKRTLKTLTVGSVCVYKFTKAVKELGHNLKIGYPSRFSPAVELLNKKYPGTAAVDKYFYERENEPDYSEWEADRYVAPEGLNPDEIDWDSFDYECE